MTNVHRLNSSYGIPVRIPRQFTDLRGHIGMGLRELALLETPPEVPEDLLDNDKCVNQRIKLNDTDTRVLFQKLRPQFKSNKTLIVSALYLVSKTKDTCRYKLTKEDNF